MKPYHAFPLSSTDASGRARHRDRDGYYAFSTLVRSVA
jgi:hypothetical protein